MCIKNRIIAILILVSGIIGMTVGACSSGGSAPVQTTQAATPVAVAQPATAKEVATTVGCVKFKDHGHALGVVDSGTCWKHGKKYGVDTFLTKDNRDEWLKAATQLGVVPKWETSTSVIYPSTGT